MKSAQRFLPQFEFFMTRRWFFSVNSSKKDPQNSWTSTPLLPTKVHPIFCFMTLVFFILYWALTPQLQKRCSHRFCSLKDNSKWQLFLVFLLPWTQKLKLRCFLRTRLLFFAGFSSRHRHAVFQETWTVGRNWSVGLYLTKSIWDAPPCGVTQTLLKKQDSSSSLGADAPGGVVAFSCSHSSSPHSVLTWRVSHAPEALKV